MSCVPFFRKKRETEKETKTEKVDKDIVIDKDDQQLCCPVCYELAYPPIITECGHIFCLDCIKRYKHEKCLFCNVQHILLSPCFQLKEYIEKKKGLKGEMIKDYRNLNTKREGIGMYARNARAKIRDKLYKDIWKIIERKAGIGIVRTTIFVGDNCIILEKDMIAIANSIIESVFQKFIREGIDICQKGDGFCEMYWGLDDEKMKKVVKEDAMQILDIDDVEEVS